MKRLILSLAFAVALIAQPTAIYAAPVSDEPTRNELLPEADEFYQFTDEAVMRLQIAVGQYVAQGHMASKIKVFWQGYNNSKRNWDQKGIRFPYNPPARVQIVDADWNTLKVTLYPGDELVVDPVPPAPWEIEGPVPPDPGTVIFGPPAGVKDCYLDGGSAVEKGHIATGPDGKSYRFHIIGTPGHLNYLRIWVPVGTTWP